MKFIRFKTKGPSEMKGLEDEGIITRIHGSFFQNYTVTDETYTMADITPEWVRSIFKVEHMNASGNVAIHRPYSQPNGEFNTGSTKVTMETTRDGLINAYPTQRGALQNMSEDYTLRDLPGVYYKKRRK